MDSSNFSFPKRGKVCIKCEAKRRKTWRKNNPEIIKLAKRRSRMSLPVAERERKRARDTGKLLKQTVISHYSDGKNECHLCKFNDIRALTIDHICGGGRKHLKSLGILGGWGFYKWLIKNNYPEGFQVLCMNCQIVKRHTHGEGVVIER
jgi:hypothetical protein